MTWGVGGGGLELGAPEQGQIQGKEREEFIDNRERGQVPLEHVERVGERRRRVNSK